MLWFFSSYNLLNVCSFFSSAFSSHFLFSHSDSFTPMSKISHENRKCSIFFSLLFFLKGRKTLTWHSFIDFNFINITTASFNQDTDLQIRMPILQNKPLHPTVSFFFMLFKTIKLAFNFSLPLHCNYQPIHVKLFNQNYLLSRNSPILLPACNSTYGTIIQ